MTGALEETFETPYTKEHRLGGREAGKGLKYFGCFVLNSCQKYGDDYFYEPLNAYRWLLSSFLLVTWRLYFSAVTTKRDFCNLTQINFKDPGRNETRQAAFYDDCVKKDHPNVFICPRSGNTVFQISNNTAHDVKILENQLKEIKKKKKTRRNKRKQNKSFKRKKRRRKNRKKRRNKGRFQL